MASMPFFSLGVLHSKTPAKALKQRHPCRLKQDIMHRLTPEEKYKYKIRKQEIILEEFAKLEFEWSDHLITWYRLKKMDMPDDQYRACAFFQNREYKNKPGSLTLLYQMNRSCLNELPEITNENAFDILCFRYRMYAEVLKKGGFDGKHDW